MQGIIKVTPNDLINTSTEFSSKGTAISNLTAEMLTEVTGLASIWEGDAATAYINKFRGLEDDIQRINNMVQEHVEDLVEMASAYENAENENVQITSDLTSDVIV